MRVDVPAVVERSAVTTNSTLATAAVTPVDVSESGAAPAAGAPAEPGLKVTLSAEGLMRSKTESKNSDIDESGLPDTVKQLLKMIRELKAQLAEKMAELQALMAQSDMDDETRQARAQALQTEVGSISGALTTATAELARVMRDQKLSTEQSAAVGSLLNA
ncbi:hypothetical protein D16iCDA_03460 [Pseudomonas seleniipraecipitans]|uniref:Chemotaxis protein n=1 Tax=Phytopseudomonas seleniipraecipitans TaxID=640205 RepID=A0ABY5JD32_9GAMM|nr:hypothetical protein [Pseudomonas seleniipraecipitans]UUD64767.1 hypothetical protein D16iCDA_03460 [Pseudomonas seleniipraecipitans]